MVREYLAVNPLLEEQGIPQSGFHSFRRYRNTYLRNVAGCPDGLLKYWLGQPAARDMSDRYDKVRDDAAFRPDQAKKMGLGFKLPKALKPTQKRNKITVHHVLYGIPNQTRREWRNPHKHWVKVVGG